LIRILLIAVSIAIFSTAAFANVPRTSHVAEKPHQGVSGFDADLHQGFAASNPLNAPGMPAHGYEFRGRGTSVTLTEFERPRDSVFQTHPLPSSRVAGGGISGGRQA
jgi:hypothetical protein